ncbi:hypothetical protein PHYBLDRAFT_146887 [Phycomyces blakesleeanus NRRL 1555(-)]|uniref:Uncharacterized protein n=1 Tax=Phycomyces blakesleeanus (strain ATCC 8743b / DSM 1359 / FGSC 10004 / NBRC 33097 / NRRL 1555) TaxID=763407 RepID=A0A162N7S9_PHYB8|nr:hypothetical protein PHYBLDRAFT_146887 [Phycomyces blakesleeanus NRRL 1555(-)]OAD71908.1 hypothetical protein PHYBLDRAFT_146887 [Phycomyces blakesleeanus NRRL 1555(-)]|eukprot:XP_018289948.1 hypothetical protein PHYBLDRAFT_146887 [Phycomyces blakesleeanus NRRL 1555(-)]
MSPLSTNSATFKRRFFNKLDKEEPERLLDQKEAESSRSTDLSTFVGSNAFVASQNSSSNNVSKFELALKALSMKVHTSTAEIYIMPLEISKYPYTIGPTESVFKQTYMKSVSVETDDRTDIGLRAEDNEESSLTLFQVNTLTL